MAGERRDDRDRRRAAPSGREQAAGRSQSPPQPRRTWDVSTGTLPRWVADDLARVTPRSKLAQAIEKLTEAAEAFAAGKHGRALRLAEQAKEASPRDATIREVIGLSAYRLGRWQQALRELRTFRRYTGETTHLAVEMDVLRALDRPADIDAAWQLMQKLGGSRSARNEARVVYASHLLDRNEPRRAWEVVQPVRITTGADESELRVWYVAARVAARLGDREAAGRLFRALQEADPGFPGLDELDRLTAG